MNEVGLLMKSPSDTQPVDDSGWATAAQVSTHIVKLTFTTAQHGHKVFVRFCWMSTNSEAPPGPWSDVISATIPG